MSQTIGEYLESNPGCLQPKQPLLYGESEGTHPSDAHLDHSEIYNNIKLLDSFLQYHVFESQEEIDEFADSIRAIYSTIK